MDTSWDIARKKRLIRNDTIGGHRIKLECGVNFFVESLENAGAIARFTCEGHPTGFSIVFDAEYPLALAIKQLGYFGVTLMWEKNRWRLDLEGNENSIRYERGEFTIRDRNKILRAACLAWEQSSWFVRKTP